MALRKIRECIRDRQRPVSSRLELNVFAEEADEPDITRYGDVYLAANCRRANGSG